MTDTNYGISIGTGIAPEFITEALCTLGNAPPTSYFARDPGNSMGHLWAVLQDPTNYLSSKADSFLQSHSATIDPGKVLHRESHAAIRPLKFATSLLLTHGVRGKEGKSIFIPLQDWDSRHGCPLGDRPLRAGEYMYVDGKQAVTWPASEPGPVVLFIHAVDAQVEE